MLKAGRDPDLAKKPLATEERRQFWPQHFDGDVAVVFEILRQEDQGHPTGRDLAFHDVSPRERSTENRQHTVRSGKICGRNRTTPVVSIQQQPHFASECLVIAAEARKMGGPLGLRMVEDRVENLLNSSPAIRADTRI